MFAFVGCGEDANVSSADLQQRKATSQAAAEAERQVGMPRIVNFNERKMARQILELRDDAKLVCYAYFFVPMTGELKFYGKCMGYGLPYSTQFTNPSRPEEVDVEGHPNAAVVLQQPDPNQLFMPTSSSATWLMMIDEKTGETVIDYVEPKIIVTPIKRH
jgi:hypothetical protein